MRKILLLLLVLSGFQIKAQCWKTIAAGATNTFALKTDGTLWGWGDNSLGQLGDGSYTNKNIPKKIGNANDWNIVSVGTKFTIALKTDGTLWAWGSNYYGQLGDGTTTTITIPKQIGTANDWQTIATGSGYTVALKKNGTLWTWGSNNYGQLGDGTTVRKINPVQIGTSTDWKTIAAGYGHTVAIKTDGSLWAWGDNDYGRLGDGTTTARTVPTRIGTSTDWKTIAAGYDHTVAIKTDGSIWAWGLGTYGQLGRSTAQETIPTRIGTSTDWKTVGAGGDFTIALKTDGTLWGWGINSYGELGNGTNTNSKVPIQIGLVNNWQTIATSSAHTVVLKTDDSLWTWGQNSDSQLGDGTNSDKNVPIPIDCQGVFTITAAQTNISCGGDSNGSASITSVSGGTTPYSYLWSNGETVAAITGLTAGNYSCTITDAASLSITKSFTITQPTSVSFTTTSTNACNSNNNGSITGTATGGTAPYQYAISPNFVYQTSNIFSNLSAGAYTVYVKDANGCINSNTITVNASNSPAPTANTQTFNIGATVANLQASGINIKWYNTNIGGTSLSTSTVLQTDKYYASQTVNGCESTRTAIDVITQAYTAYTLIPDINFENKLITLGIDSGIADGKVLTSSIVSLQSLDVSSSSIVDLTGIQDFLNLKELRCYANQLISLNVSKNTALMYLSCSFNNLTTLDVSMNKGLTTLGCGNNQLTTLDISKNTALTNLGCLNNQLTALDVSKNSALTILDCSNNQLTALDISKNTFLKYFSFNTNQLTFIDLSKNTALFDLSCYSNRLTVLDVSINKDLTSLYCNSNNLATLDLAKNTALTTLDCSSNQLKSLGLKNGKNIYFSPYINFQNNINLTCIEVDNKTYSDTNWANNKDASAIYSTSCVSSYQLIPVANFTASTTTVNNNGSINFKDNSTNTPTSWAWEATRTGSTTLTSSLQNPTFTFVDAGTYTVKLTVTNAVGSNTKTVENMITVFISLPSNNFTVESKSETCANENNGEISIVAKEIYSYVATINGKSYPFVNNSLKVSNLPPAAYNVSVSIMGEIFEQNFTCNISKGVTVTAKSAIASRRATVEMIEGTAPYKIFVNGKEQFESAATTFSIDVNKGDLLEVKTAKACEGVYSKGIDDLLGEGSVSAYPNPTSGKIEIAVPTFQKEIAIEIYTINAQFISRKTYTVESGKIQLNIENQPTGVYNVKIYLDQARYLKIIKK
jgi:alpha-tubulin suppressor-like RCC1 family protein/PKD repeat protein